MKNLVTALPHLLLLSPVIVNITLVLAIIVGICFDHAESVVLALALKDTGVAHLIGEADEPDALDEPDESFDGYEGTGEFGFVPQKHGNDT